VTALCFTTVGHERTVPLQHAFSYRQPMWLVDVDQLPSVPRWARSLLRFDAADHFGDPDATIRANVDAFLAEHGVAAPARVVLLANPRSLGHCFNPLSVYWCTSGDGDGVAIIAEVHNTYGGRHCYLVRPDGSGRAEMPKALYVSPFFPVDGSYELEFSELAAPLDVRIALRRPNGRRSNECGPDECGPDESGSDEVVFRAALTAGPPVPVRSVLASALRHLGSSWWVSARIRRQGIRLWLRGLHTFPRSAPHRSAAAVPHESALTNARVAQESGAS
jgi:DUF1365 family protein